MDLEEYSERQRSLIAALIALVLAILSAFRYRRLGTREWDVLLTVLYPHVESYCEQAACLGREFFDSQRAEHHPGLHEVFLAEYQPQWFAEALIPERTRILGGDMSESAVMAVALRVAKVVEDAGRRTILHGVDTDRDVQGWARVATGRETCGWCLMLISRGPVFLSADTAGLDVDDTTAADLWDMIASARSATERREAEAAMDALMRRWHTGCDCQVVPVYDREAWPGRDAFLRAQAIWKTVTKGYTGNDAINAFRRAIENRDVDTREFAAA